MNSIEINSLTKSFGDFNAVDDITLKIESGEIFGFLGPNGAGKTTAIRILTGFLNPTSGMASIFGMNCWKDTVDISKKIGFVPDLSSLYDNSTGIELLDYFGSLHGGLNRNVLNELCEALKLSHKDLNRKIKQYSHGMKRKLAIIQAMQHQPDLLIMDEPTQGLDPLTQISLFGILKSFIVQER